MKTNIFLIIALLLLVGTLSAQDNRASVQLAAAIYEEEVTGDLDKAVQLYQNILKEYPNDRPVAARTFYHLGLVNEKMGKEKASEYFTHLINTYPDQPEVVALAKARLAAFGAPVATVPTEKAMRRIWVSGKNAIAGISTDGRYVVYNLSSSGDLWLHDLQSGEDRPITRDASGVAWTYAYGKAAVSPDGKQIAFNWWEGHYGEVRLSSLDGSSKRVLYNGKSGKYMFVQAWMPDNQRILATSFNIKDQTNQLHLITLADGAVQDIGQAGYEEFGNVCPSPDGKYSAFTRNDDIFIYNPGVEQESSFIQNTATEILVGWTPEGTGIVFISNRSGAQDLYLLGIENGKPQGNMQLLRKDFGTNPGISLTPDGRLFRAENTGTRDSYIVSVDERTGKLTDTPLLVEPNYPDVGYVGWSPDGRLLYYEHHKESTSEFLLFIRSEETGQTREITLKPKLEFWYDAILSPDGHQFAVTGQDENKSFGIFIIDAENGDVSQIVRIPQENDPVIPSQNWSPDGSAIFYKVRSLENSDEFIIRCKDLATGEEKDVYRGFNTREMRISSDGSRIVYFRHDLRTRSFIVGILEFESGEEHELWRFPETESQEVFNTIWSPDNKYVLVARDVKQGTELWRIPSAGGPAEKLHLFPENNMWGFTLHPDGKKMAYTQVRQNNELWVMENFLPE